MKRRPHERWEPRPHLQPFSFFPFSRDRPASPPSPLHFLAAPGTGTHGKRGSAFSSNIAYQTAPSARARTRKSNYHRSLRSRGGGDDAYTRLTRPSSPAPGWPPPPSRPAVRVRRRQAGASATATGRAHPPPEAALPPGAGAGSGRGMRGAAPGGEQAAPSEAQPLGTRTSLHGNGGGGGEEEQEEQGRREKGRTRSSADSCRPIACIV